MSRSYQLFLYLIKKIVAAFMTIFLVITATFFIMRSIPGSIYSNEKALSDAAITNIQAKYHLNDPLFEQYRSVLLNTFKLDFGYSMVYEGRSVNEIIASHFPVSALLGAITVVFSLIFGLLIGIVIAKNNNRFGRYFLTACVVLGMSAPSFALAVILQYLFSVKFEVFPVISGLKLYGYILPLLALCAYPASFLAKLVSSGLDEVMQKGFIAGARARGIGERRILFVHALRNVALPIFAYVGPLLAGLLVGSFAIETIFSIPGLGRYYILSVADRDYTTIMGITFFYSSILVTINLVLDAILGLLDPRVVFKAQ